MNKDTLCPTCLKDGKVSICNPKDDAFWECPSCRCGVWPPEDDPDMVKRERQQAEVNNTYRSCSLPEGVHVVGGNTTVGKAKVEAMGKKTTARLNYDLGEKRFF